MFGHEIIKFLAFSTIIKSIKGYLDSSIDIDMFKKLQIRTGKRVVVRSAPR